jgi:hypothetical protein
MITAFFEGKILNICLERFGKNLGENSCSPLKFEHRIWKWRGFSHLDAVYRAMSWCRQLLAFHYGCPGLIAGLSLWHWWWMKCQWDRFSLKCLFILPCQCHYISVSYLIYLWSSLYNLSNWQCHSMKRLKMQRLIDPYRANHSSDTQSEDVSTRKCQQDNFCSFPSDYSSYSQKYKWILHYCKAVTWWSSKSWNN